MTKPASATFKPYRDSKGYPRLLGRHGGLGFSAQATRRDGVAIMPLIFLHRSKNIRRMTMPDSIQPDWLGVSEIVSLGPEENRQVMKWLISRDQPIKMERGVESGHHIHNVQKI